MQFYQQWARRNDKTRMQAEMLVAWQQELNFNIKADSSEFRAAVDQVEEGLRRAQQRQYQSNYAQIDWTNGRRPSYQGPVKIIDRICGADMVPAGTIIYLE